MVTPGLTTGSVAVYFNTKDLDRVAGRLGDIDFVDGVSGDQISPSSPKPSKLVRADKKPTKDPTDGVQLMPVSIGSLQEMDQPKAAPQPIQLQVPTVKRTKKPNDSELLEENIGLKAVKDFETIFNVKLIENELAFRSREDPESFDKVYYLELQEADVVEEEDQEVEDENWFDGDNVIMSDNIKNLEVSYQTFGSMGGSNVNPSLFKTSKLSRKKQGGGMSGYRDEVLGPLYRLCKLKDGESVTDFKIRTVQNNFVPVIYFLVTIWVLILGYLGLRIYFMRVSQNTEKSWKDQFKNIYNIELYMVSTLQNAVLLSDLASNPQSDTSNTNSQYKQVKESLHSECNLYYQEYLKIKTFEKDFGVSGDEHKITTISYLSEGTRLETPQDFNLGLKNYYTNCFFLVDKLG